MVPAAGARCAKHREASAVDVCQRCGTFLCGECVNIQAEDVFCAECAGILSRPESARAKLAFGLAVAPGPLLLVLTFAAGGLGTLLGLGLLLPLGAGALALLLRERSSRRQGQTPRRRGFYRLAWAALGLDVAGTIGLVWFVVSSATDT